MCICHLQLEVADLVEAEVERGEGEVGAQRLGQGVRARRPDGVVQQRQVLQPGVRGVQAWVGCARDFIGGWLEQLRNSC